MGLGRCRGIRKQSVSGDNIEVLGRCRQYERRRRSKIRPVVAAPGMPDHTYVAARIIAGGCDCISDGRGFRRVGREDEDAARNFEYRLRVQRERLTVPQRN